jgi:hypothetical protein
MFFEKSSFATGDIFGTQKIMTEFEERRQELPIKDQENILIYSAAISKVKQDNGVMKFTNRFSQHKRAKDES